MLKTSPKIHDNHFFKADKGIKSEEICISLMQTQKHPAYTELGKLYVTNKDVTIIHCIGSGKTLKQAKAKAKLWLKRSIKLIEKL